MKLYINANRTGYSPCQIQHTMTVGELSPRSRRSTRIPRCS